MKFDKVDNNGDELKKNIAFGQYGRWCDVTSLKCLTKDPLVCILLTIYQPVIEILWQRTHTLQQIDGKHRKHYCLLHECRLIFVVKSTVVPVNSEWKEINHVIHS